MIDDMISVGVQTEEVEGGKEEELLSLILSMEESIIDIDIKKRIREAIADVQNKLSSLISIREMPLLSLMILLVLVFLEDIKIEPSDNILKSTIDNLDKIIDEMMDKMIDNLDKTIEDMMDEIMGEVQDKIMLDEMLDEMTDEIMDKIMDKMMYEMIDKMIDKIKGKICICLKDIKINKLEKRKPKSGQFDVLVSDINKITEVNKRLQDKLYLSTFVNCIVCLYREREIRYSSCGHMVTCQECTNAIMECPAQQRKCPVCRKRIVRPQKTFLS